MQICTFHSVYYLILFYNLNFFLQKNKSSKIYEFFSTKDQLCEALCQIHCENLIENLQSIPKKRDTGYYLTDLIRQTLEYHRSHPHSDALMTLVCFEPERFKIPDNFLKIEILFKEALKELNSPFLKSAKDLEIALTIIRYLFIGTSHLMNTKNNSSESLEIAMNAIHILIKGWKSV